MNVNKVIVDFTGKPTLMSFPRVEEDRAKSETVGNVLLNALTTYPVGDKKEVFYVTKVAHQIIAAQEKKGDMELHKMYIPFMKEVIYSSMFRTEQDGEKSIEKGFYMPFVIAQVLNELGIKN